MKKKKKRERRKTFREDKKGGVWVPYGQVTVIDLQLYFFFLGNHANKQCL